MYSDVHRAGTAAIYTSRGGVYDDALPAAQREVWKDSAIGIGVCRVGSYPCAVRESLERKGDGRVKSIGMADLYEAAKERGLRIIEGTQELYEQKIEESREPKRSDSGILVLLLMGAGFYYISKSA